MRKKLIEPKAGQIVRHEQARTNVTTLATEQELQMYMAEIGLEIFGLLTDAQNNELIALGQLKKSLALPSQTSSAGILTSQDAGHNNYTDRLSNLLISIRPKLNPILKSKLFETHIIPLAQERMSNKNLEIRAFSENEISGIKKMNISLYFQYILFVTEPDIGMSNAVKAHFPKTHDQLNFWQAYSEIKELYCLRFANLSNNKAELTRSPSRIALGQLEQHNLLHAESTLREHRSNGLSYLNLLDIQGTISFRWIIRYTLLLCRFPRAFR